MQVSRIFIFTYFMYFFSLIWGQSLFAQEKNIDLTLIHIQIFNYYQFENPYQKLTDSIQQFGEQQIVEYQKKYNDASGYGELCFPNNKKLDSLQQVLVYEQKLLEDLYIHLNDTLFLIKVEEGNKLRTLISEIVIAEVMLNTSLDTQQLLSILRKNKSIKKAFVNWNKKCLEEWQMTRSIYLKNQQLSPSIEQKVLEILQPKRQK